MSPHPDDSQTQSEADLTFGGECLGLGENFILGGTSRRSLPLGYPCLIRAGRGSNLHLASVGYPLPEFPALQPLHSTSTQNPA